MMSGPERWPVPDEGPCYLGPTVLASLIAGEDGEPKTHTATARIACRAPYSVRALMDGDSLSSPRLGAR